MLPILISLGPIKIYSYGVFLLIALFVGLYWWWKMGRDEHWEEIELFDGYFLSLLVFFVSARGAYVLFHPMVQTWYRALAFLAYPGLTASIGIIASFLYLLMYARARNWEVWKVLDVVAVTLSVIVSICAIGAMLNGSNPGLESSWGIVHPGDTVRRFPVDLWTFLWGILTFGLVSRVRKQFRFFSWYKGDSNVAKDGLACLFFGLMSGIYLIIAGLVDDISWRIWVIPTMSLFGLGIVLSVALFIYLRSGRGRTSNLLQWVSRLGKGR